MLGKIIGQLPAPEDENLLVGFNTADDAGVYKISEDKALIQTVDFFTPIVDDPYMFGQISAANSMSDVYAMGGIPLTALNIVAFSSSIFPAETLVAILQGGFDKVREAGAVIVGGHTATDDELKYGLAVTGIVHPDKVVKNSTARPGDQLLLTKPLGTGIITTALKAGKDLGTLRDQVSTVMATLNDKASRAMQKVGVHACTDITGFGLMGHALEMASGSAVGLRLAGSRIPLFEEALPLVRAGHVPGGTRSNQAFLEGKVHQKGNYSEEQITLFFDAQTSGGLLIAVARERLNQLLDELHEENVQTIAVIGEVVDDHPGEIVIE